MLFGLVCVFGCFAGLDHLATAVLLWIPEQQAPTEQMLIGILLASCLLGGLVAGTANRKAELTGLTVGVLAAFGHLWQLNRTGETLPGEWVFGFPLMAGLVGVMAGFAGRLIYPPVPIVPLIGSSGIRSLAIEPTIETPVVIWRVLLGAALIVAGTYWAGSLQHHLSRIIGSKFGSFGGSSMVVWQMATLAAVLGGTLAGANTAAGLKQGMLAGLPAGLAIAAMHWKYGGERPMGVEFWQDQLSLNQQAPALLGVLVGSVTLISTLGGWLGSRLLQPKK